METRARAVPLLQKVMSVAINMLLYLHGIWSIKFVQCSIRHLSTIGEDLQVSLLEYIKRVSGDLLLKRKFISSIATMKKVFDQIVRDLLEEMLLDMETMDILGQQALLKTPVKPNVRAFVNSKNEGFLYFQKLENGHHENEESKGKTVGSKIKLFYIIV
ncbi:uncharacterized protein LOC131225613 isoform X2 [Magnolia sinica]|uniref:uncharacterized protein LOC131225613 isoform X2 n=1 Tax=Magnolia sinica TaxID=86752 RepID=UPI00265B035B|nr:uncharacterized protein LOC131225613 isoform X2 [Magnolia sinica]